MLYSYKYHGYSVFMSIDAMPQIPDLVHSRLLEARDLWAKAEASQDTDKTVSYMLFSQHNGQ